MAEPDKRPATMEELFVSSLAQTDALAILSLSAPYADPNDKASNAIRVRVAGFMGSPLFRSTQNIPW